MHATTSYHRAGKGGLASAVLSGLLFAGLALASPAALAAGGGEGGDSGGASGGGGGGGGGAGDASGGGGGAGGGAHRSNKSDLTTCEPGLVWDAKKHRCLSKHSGVLPDPELTEYAYSLAKAGRYQEALDVLDMLDNPNTPRALNYRGYATRKLGRTDEGIGYYLKSVALDPAYPQVREYLGEAYVIEGKFDLAKDQLATIEKLCGSTDCEYYQDLSDALQKAHAL